MSPFCVFKPPSLPSHTSQFHWKREYETMLGLIWTFRSLSLSSRRHLPVGVAHLSAVKGRGRRENVRPRHKDFRNQLNQPGVAEWSRPTWRKECCFCEKTAHSMLMCAAAVKKKMLVAFLCCRSLLDRLSVKFLKALAPSINHIFIQLFLTALQV